MGYRVASGHVARALWISLILVVVAACGSGPAPPVTPAPIPTAKPPWGQPLLSWAPPTLTNPQTIELGPGVTVSDLNPIQDYIIKLPDEVKKQTFIKGGHNIVIIGGYISGGSDTPPWGSPEHRRLYIADATGTVHIEGVLFDHSNPGDSDAIEIAAPQATVQIENVRAVDLTGQEQGNHTDVIQVWGGVKELRVDRLTGSSDYQGLTIDPDLAPTGRRSSRTSTCPRAARQAGTGWFG
ncbi:MAG: hypothetical protein QOK43_3373 [Acidimicrobiaceae bacterium]|nr:hypothetical protein [Acidimicrobiaceae bacterium]